MRYKRFRAMLIEERKKAGLTQEELGTQIGWTQTDVSKVERGERRIDVIEFLEFAEAIGFDAPRFIKSLQR